MRYTDSPFSIFLYLLRLPFFLYSLYSGILSFWSYPFLWVLILHMISRVCGGLLWFLNNDSLIYKWFLTQKKKSKWFNCPGFCECQALVRGLTRLLGQRVNEDEQMASLYFFNRLGFHTRFFLIKTIIVSGFYFIEIDCFWVWSCCAWLRFPIWLLFFVTVAMTSGVGGRWFWCLG